MQLIELPVFVGAPLAKWRRIYGFLTLGEVLRKIRQRIAGKMFLWYRDGLALAFKARNLVTRNAAIAVSAGGVGFQIVPEGAVAFHAWSRLRFERAELEFILQVLQPGTTFFDVGANIGLFSLAAGKKLCGHPSTLYAFEPCPSTFASLEKNLLKNELATIHAVRVALSDQSGEANLYINAALKDALNSLEDPSHCDAEVVGRERVQTITLDDFVKRKNIARVDVMKVDVEGAELLVFRGGRKLLGRPDAPLILYEGYSWCTAGFHYHPVELMWQLEELGYELFILDPESGGVHRRRTGESYDAMVVAAKRSHLCYSEIFLSGEEA
ncbi:MAG TPA: FkbM family methyltransferase [Candidatus Acidoferrum sp.]|nr:FkbM family methyltransferase [Candidatus Acidoferrum sp.]